jgi:hypothetical protein
VFIRLIVSAIASVVIAFAGAFGAVVSQNPGSSVPGPGFVYGSPSAPAP